MEPFVTPLGIMSVIEHFLFYDRPYIFLCVDKTNSKYVVHLVDDDEFCEKWFLIPSTELRVEFVRTGKISLRDSLLLAEQGWIWEITTPFDDSKGTANIRYCNELAEHDLPAKDVVLNLPERRLPVLDLDVARDAEQAFRDVFLLYLNDGHHSQTISANDLGLILLRSQGILETLAHKDVATRGRIPATTKEGVTMYYAGNFAASVGIRLEAKYNGLVPTSVHDALSTLMDLIEAGAIKENLLAILKKLQSRSIVRYRFFLQALEQANISFKAEWGSPFREKRVASLSIQDIRSAIGIMNLEGEDTVQNLELIGDLRLIGVQTNKNKKRSSFEFVSIEGEVYKGTLSDDLLEKVASGIFFKVPTYNVIAAIEENIEINPATSEEKISYSLLNIKENK